MYRKNSKEISKVMTMILAAGFMAMTLSGCLNDTGDTVTAGQDTAAISEQADSMEPKTDAAAETGNDTTQGTETDKGTENSGERLNFSTTDLDGNQVTSDIFKNKKLTVINIWGTFCGPCINELPDLESWSEGMPDDVQIIGIVGDVADSGDTEHIKLAKDILKKAGVKYMNIIPSDDIADLMGEIYGFPTTIFVDSKGNIVGSPIVGADVDGYRSFVKGYLNEKK